MSMPLRQTGECLSVLGYPKGKEKSLHWFGSGTSALTAVLRAAGRLTGSKRKLGALMPAAVCPSVYIGVVGAGLAPVFVTSDPFEEGYNLDLSALEDFPADKAVAVIWVHQYGCIGQFEQLSAVCRRKGWVLVEDAALTFGAGINGRAAGTLGDCGIFSFGRGKVVDVGYGGAAVLNEGSIADDLAPLLYEEWSKINQRDMTNDIAVAAFDQKLKRLYNARYNDLRNGSLTAELYPSLSSCIPHTCRFDAQRFDRALPPGTLASAGTRVRSRNNRADWLIAKFERARVPTITGIVRHKAGTYWRLNVLIDPRARHSILKAGLVAGLPISSWYPPLYWLVPDAIVVGDPNRETAFADCVINFWVDGVEDWEEYWAAIYGLLDLKPSTVRV